MNQIIMIDDFDDSLHNDDDGDELDYNDYGDDDDCLN